MIISLLGKVSSKKTGKSLVFCQTPPGPPPPTVPQEGIIFVKFKFFPKCRQASCETGNATMTGIARGCLKKVAPEKKVFGHFLLLDGSIWTETMLYDHGISLRRSGYPTCLYSEKN